MAGEVKFLITRQLSGRQDAFPAVINPGSKSTHRTKPGRSEIVISERIGGNKDEDNEI